jgi:hypothetical protein
VVMVVKAPHRQGHMFATRNWEQLGKDWPRHIAFSMHVVVVIVVSVVVDAVVVVSTVVVVVVVDAVVVVVERVVVVNVVVVIVVHVAHRHMHIVFIRGVAHCE